uniref:Uncharacterized protein n=1 Tax=Rhipicephalus zambeziensis TaxID=60191 RepID=A0A224Y7H6_9ACAR
MGCCLEGAGGHHLCAIQCSVCSASCDNGLSAGLNMCLCDIFFLYIHFMLFMYTSIIVVITFFHFVAFAVVMTVNTSFSWLYSLGHLLAERVNKVRGFNQAL